MGLVDSYSEQFSVDIIDIDHDVSILGSKDEREWLLSEYAMVYKYLSRAALKDKDRVVTNRFGDLLTTIQELTRLKSKRSCLVVRTVANELVQLAHPSKADDFIIWRHDGKNLVRVDGPVDMGATVIGIKQKGRDLTLHQLCHMIYSDDDESSLTIKIRARNTDAQALIDPIISDVTLQANAFKVCLCYDGKPPAMFSSFSKSSNDAKPPSDPISFYNNFVAQHVYVVTPTTTFIGTSRSVPLLPKNDDGREETTMYAHQLCLPMLLLLHSILFRPSKRATSSQDFS